MLKIFRHFRHHFLRLLFRCIGPAVNWISEHCGPIRVLFVVSSNFGFGYQLPIIQMLEKCPSVRIGVTKESWTSAMEMSCPVMKDTFDRHFIPLKRARLQKWHYRIGTTFFRSYYFYDIIGVELQHGAIIGNSAHAADRARHPASDIVFFASSNFKEFIAQADPEIWNTEKKLFFSVGLPKLDALYQGLHSREQTLKELDLPKERKTILIGSHWSPGSILRTFRAELLLRLAAAFPDYNIIQTAHEHLWMNPSGAVMPAPKAQEDVFDSAKLMAELKQAEKRFPNVRIQRGANVLPLMNAADLFVGDFSSSLVEFCVLDRPVLYFDNPEVHFHDETIRRLYREAADAFTGLDGVEAFVSSALEHPERRQEGRMKIVRYAVDYPGCSAKRAADLILAMGRIGSPRSSRWRHAAELSRQ